MPAPISLPYRRASEPGFSLIEVIIAMAILAVVMSGAALAVTSADTAERTTKAVADHNAIAEKAFERLQGDLSKRSECENSSAKWRDAAAQHVRSGSTQAAGFAVCKVAYSDIRDNDGRVYTTTLSVQPLDTASDGTGANDVDKNLRDDYEVSAKVELAPGSTTGLENLEPVEVPGSVDWGETTTDLATVRVYACAINRPDRSLLTGQCSADDAERTPLGNVAVQLVRRAENGNTAKTLDLVSADNGVAEAAALVEPGNYTVTVPSTHGGMKLFRLDPKGLRVNGSGTYEVNVTYVSTGMTVEVCTQINNFKDPDDGYEVLATNLHYRRAGIPGHRALRLYLNPNAPRPFTCGHMLLDPLNYGTSTEMFAGMYDLEVEQSKRTQSPYVWGLKLQEVSLNCNTSAAWNAPMGGSTARIADRSYAVDDDRKPTGTESAPSWYGTMNVGSTPQNQRLCLRFYSKQFEREECPPFYPHLKTIYYSWTDSKGVSHTGSYQVTDYDRPEYAPGCFYSGTRCIQNCPDGKTVCVAYCNNSDADGGTLGAEMVDQTAKPFMGPADDTVGCTPQDSRPPFPDPMNHTVLPGKPTGNGATWDEMRKYNWVGGDANYYNKFSGSYSSGGTAYCNDVVFAASSKWLCLEGKNKAAYDDNGFFGCKYHYMDCIQMEFVQYPGTYVRGRVRDISVNYSVDIIPSINSLRTLTMKNQIPNKEETTERWHPGSWWTSLTVKVRKVNDAPSCGGSPPPEYKTYPPVFKDVWERVVNDPAINAPPPRTGYKFTLDKVAL